MKDEQIESTEYVAVWVALLQFSYCDGRPVDPHERNLVGELLQLAAKYNSNGHWVASQLEKLLHQVQVMPRTAPERPAWFLATIESRLQRQTGATASNLATAPDPEARRILTGLMAHATLEIAPEERRAREFEQAAGGDRFQAFQDCLAGCRNSSTLEGRVLIDVALWMLTEGWHREFPVSGTLVKMEPRSETGQSERKKQA